MHIYSYTPNLIFCSHGLLKKDLLLYYLAFLFSFKKPHYFHNGRGESSNKQYQKKKNPSPIWGKESNI